jgi:hypothetical protein
MLNPTSPQKTKTLASFKYTFNKRNPSTPNIGENGPIAR